MERLLLQSITLRLQKERDSSAQEVVNLQEKMDLLQSQMAKATRDRELLLSETETSRERYDKLNQSLLKLQVHQVEVDILVEPAPTYTLARPPIRPPARLPACPPLLTTFIAFLGNPLKNPAAGLHAPPGIQDRPIQDSLRLF